MEVLTLLSHCKKKSQTFLHYWLVFIVTSTVEIFSTLTMTKSEAITLNMQPVSNIPVLNYLTIGLEESLPLLQTYICCFVHTSTEYPSTYLIKQLCSTQYNQVKNIPALKWGRNNEEIAQKAYSETQSAIVHPGMYFPNLLCDVTSV